MKKYLLVVLSFGLVSCSSSVSKYEKECEGLFCSSYGYIYETKKDYYKAAELYQKGCKTGNYDGCSAIKNLFMNNHISREEYFKILEQ